MRVRSSLRRRRGVGLALAGCSLALVIPAGASAQTDPTSDADRSASAVPTHDLRSPDTRDAALAAVSETPTSPATVTVQPTIVPVVDDGSQTLAIVLSSTALFLALAAVGFAALYRRPRPRWSAS